jgi:hypothetical protein
LRPKKALPRWSGGAVRCSRCGLQYPEVAMTEGVCIGCRNDLRRGRLYALGVFQPRSASIRTLECYGCHRTYPVGAFPVGEHTRLPSMRCRPCLRAMRKKADKKVRKGKLLTVSL